MDLVILGVVWLVLLGLKGFFSGSEIAIVNADKFKLQSKAEQGDPGSRIAINMLRRPERLLATTLVGTNIATVSLAVLTTTFFVEVLGDGGDLIALLVGTPILLIFGEIVPKSVYQQSADTMTPMIARALRAFSWLFMPIVLVFSTVARLLARLTLGKRTDRTFFVVREQLRALLDMSEHTADVDVLDRVRIKNVIRFADITVGEVMTPIANVTGIPAANQVRDVVDAARRTGFRHFPVYQDNLGNVVGTVCVSTWEMIDPNLQQKALSDIMAEPLFVTSNAPVEDLLSSLRKRQDQMAVVVNEYETAIGMVTVTDITRLIVGQIGGNAGGTVSGAVVKGTSPSGDTYDVDAHLRVSQINELLGTDLTSDTFHTVGGFLATRLRRVPATGDHLEYGGYKFTVSEATRKGPVRIRIEPV